MQYVVTSAALALTIAVSACATGARQQEFSQSDAATIKQNAAELSTAFNEKNLDKIRLIEG